MPVLRGELPDLFQFADGSRVRSPEDWLRRREELRDLILATEYGPLPPLPDAVRGELLHHHLWAASDALKADHFTYRLHLDGGRRPFWFLLDLLVPHCEGEPSADRKLPVVVNGDGCWRYVTDEVTAEVLRRGYVLATFNRTELAPDIYRSDRDTALYTVYPGTEFWALGAWAWGYHRVIDLLLTREEVEPSQIAVVGHSRGGKTVLLAGATDERIALTAPNNSGSGGAGCFRWQGEDCEKLEDGVRMVPYWYAPRLAEFVGREEDLPFDQHALKALVAPRALLSTEALGDLWANPSGTYQTHLAAREVYRFLGAEERLGIWYREGDHDHGLADWRAFLDFADLQFRGLESATRFDENPFPGMQPAFSWSSPVSKEGSHVPDR